MLTATFDNHLQNMPFVLFANSEVETERNQWANKGRAEVPERPFRAFWHKRIWEA